MCGSTENVRNVENNAFKIKKTPEKFVEIKSKPVVISISHTDFRVFKHF